MKEGQFYPCYRVINQEGIVGCSGELSGILTGGEIKKWALIDEPDMDAVECLRGTTYDLRLGEGHFLYKDGDWKLFYIGEDIGSANYGIEGQHQFIRQNPARAFELTINPFSTALVQLHETVDTLSVAEKSSVLVAGRFDLRVSMVIKGLVSQQATQVEPCYKGKLFCFLYNNTGNEVVLRYQERIATIEFYYISCLELRNQMVRDMLINTMKTANKAKYSIPRYCFDYGIKDVRYFAVSRAADFKLQKGGGLATFEERFNKLLRKVTEETSLDNILPKIKKELKHELDKGLRKWKVIIPTISAVLITLGGFILNDILGKKKDEYIKDLDGKYKEIIQKIEEQKKSSVDSMEKLREQILTEIEKKRNDNKIDN